MQTTKMKFDIGSYIYYASENSYSLLLKQHDPNYLGKRYDHLLHQSLDKIFRERCSSSSSSSQFKKFRCDPQHSTDWKSIIKPILDKEPILSRYFSKEKLEQLPLLWIAVLAGYEKSTELLVRSGADVNELFGRRDPQVIDEKSTVLHLLLQMHPSPHNERLTRLIVDHGADLHAQDYKGRTVLHYAIKYGRIQMTEILLEKGADVNVADNMIGMTPLLLAVSNNKVDELLPLLMKHGADVCAKNRQGENALHCLVHLNIPIGMSKERSLNAKVAKALIEKGTSTVEKVYFDHSQPIHRATEFRKVELIKVYLDHGANVNAQKCQRQSPLHLAARYYGNTKVLKTLIKRGADVNQKTLFGRTPLHIACEHAALSNGSYTEFKRENVIRLLLFGGANIIAEDFDGKTPFTLISLSKRVDKPTIWLMIKMLALKKICHPSIELKDEKIIERHPKMQKYYHNCFEEINRMKMTRFVESCTFFELLTKNHRQIAALMRNPEFEMKKWVYEREMLNSIQFPAYNKDIYLAFKRAQKYYLAFLEQETAINEAFYNMLPDLIMRKVVRYILNDSVI